MIRVPVARVAALLRERGLLLRATPHEAGEVTGVSQDSRSVKQGDLFLAWAGAQSDAHDFVPAAVRAGASAAVVEREIAAVDVPQLVVRDGRLAAALVADFVFGSPAQELLVVLVTGTNGKTTTALTLRHLLQPLGPAATIGTLGLVQPDGTVRPGSESLTTPGPVQLAGWLRNLVDEGVRIVTMEASSHALEQRRLDALRVQVAVFTNFTQDHLDYHGTLDGYFRAKARLVDLVADGGAVVVNADDPAWRNLPTTRRRVTFSVGGDADVRAVDVDARADGTRFTLEHEGQRVPVQLSLRGGFNVENALAATAAALALSIPLEVIAERLATAPQVPGRLELVSHGAFTVLIDYAHTPDALRGVIQALKPLVRGRLVVLFGAGGDRDRTKRRPMADAVAAGADYAILTSDNPRTEDPEAILDDLEPGLASIAYERVCDRREAIRRALDGARAGDVVLLAGKGHETYQIIGTEKRSFDERAVVREWLERGAA